MAKKQTKKAEVAQSEIKATNEMVEVAIEKPQSKKPEWEVKDRMYVLNGRSPLGYHLKSSGLYYFDEEAGYEREICYSRNQRTPFVDEMKGDIRIEHIWFRDGSLFVPKSNVTLQKFLSIYHPSAGKKYYEVNKKQDAANEVDYIMVELEAMNLAQSMSLEEAEAVMRVEVGSKVSEMSSKELKRDLLVFAKRNPLLFIDVANDDNIHLRNIGIKATEQNIIRLSPDQRTFLWGSTDRKLMTVPFDEHPYSALAQWFKTDEGMEVLSSVEKRLNS